MGFADYTRYDALGLADLVQRGDVTPSDLVEEAIRRIEQLNPRINAVIHPMFEPARAAARGSLPDGPFRGVPFLIKDLVALVKGEPMRAGSRSLEGYVPDHDTELVIRYRRAGLVPVGKTNTPEFGLTPFTEPRLFGPSRNPWNTERITGGSSGGSAAAVASGMVPIAGGGDGGGSIRIPASCCGLFGLKPTRGRTPTGPDRGELWQGSVVEHVLTRTVRDSAAALDATAGPDVGAPYVIAPPERPFLAEVLADPGKLRIGYSGRPFLGRQVHADCLAALERTVALLRKLGHTVEAAAPELDGTAFSRAFVVMICAEVAGDMTEVSQLTHRKLRFPDYETETWALGVLGRSLSAEQYVTAVRYLALAARRVGRFFEDFDVLLTPTVAAPPPPVGSLRLPRKDMVALEVLGRMRAGGLMKLAGAIEQSAETIFDFIPWTPVFNVTGQPAMSVPLEWNSEALPIGMHFVGRFGAEDVLFRLAGQLERVQPWADRWPPIASLM